MKPLNPIESKMTGADLLVASLRANNIETIYSLPGGQLDNLFDAIQRSNGGLKLVRTRHEQGAAYMAFGAARSTGKPAVFSVVPGPGIMNAMGALSTAWAVNSPVLSLAGQFNLMPSVRGGVIFTKSPISWQPYQPL